MLIYGIMLISTAAVLGAIASLFLKKGSDKLKFNLTSIFKNKELLIGVALYIFSNVFFIPALRFGKLSVLYPFTSLSYIASIFLSVKYLGEKMNKWKYLAIALIVLGVVLVSFE